MKRIKMVLMALVAVVAVGAVGAASASAHHQNAGTIVVQGPSGPASCDFVFDKTNWSANGGTPASWSTDVSNLAPDPSGTCAVNDMAGAGTLTKWANGDAELTADNGGFLWVETEIEIWPFPPFDVECEYEVGTGDLTGEWGFVPEPPAEAEYKAFDLSGEGELVDGDFGCPDPGVVNSLTIHADLD